jgi:hypothetical protein
MVVPCHECDGIGCIPVINENWDEWDFDTEDCPVCFGNGWIVVEGEKSYLKLHPRFQENFNER